MNQSYNKSFTNYYYTLLKLINLKILKIYLLFSDLVEDTSDKSQ